MLKSFKVWQTYLWLVPILSVFLMTGCGGSSDSSGTPATASHAVAKAPANAATGVATNKAIIATFSEAMDPSTITTATFTLQQGATAVPGTVTYSGVNAVFTPTAKLAVSTTYTATVTTGAENLAGIALASDSVWSFTTGTTESAGPQPVNLGTAGNFAILSKSGITTTGTTAVVGDMGVSPIAATAMTGFGLIADASNQFSTSSLVTGKIYAADYAVPTPANLTTAVSDMETAYTDAAGRSLPDSTELGAGNIDGMTLAPGLYKWGTEVLIPIGVTLSGGADDVWIFQIAQGLTVANGATVTLSGGAQAKNIFWQVAGQATLGTTSNVKGIILCKTAIVMQTGTIMNGRALAQTAVTLDATAITATGVFADIAEPMVILTAPVNAAPSVMVNTKASATFSEAMDSSTITTATFTLKQGTTAVPGTVIYSGVNAVFTPAANLTVSTVYTATITTGAKDLNGNALAANYTWNFTTGASADITAPTVTGTVNANGATGVALNAKAGATFSEAMDSSTITIATFTLTTGGTAVPGAVTYSGVNAVFTPTANLAVSTVYTATITTGAKDLAGNALAVNYTWSWTTGVSADITAPTVTLTTPVNAATGVAINATSGATFSEAMDPSTITIATFTLKQGATAVSGAVIYSGVNAVFTPTANLAASTLYTATITTGAMDLAGNALASDYVWSFTTGTTAAAGPASVNLGTAGTFVILAKTGITTTAGTAVVGDMGVSPIAAAAVTGFGPIMDASNQFSTSALVTGKIYASDYAVPTPANLTTAISDMETAYTDAAGRVLPDFTDLGTGNIDTMTLAPGLYKWGTGVTIPTGVTISGGANDVWIFQIAQDLSVANAAIVTLGGSAQAKNIFWQVAGQATLGTTSNFKGIILCKTSIALQTGATMNGRALAQTAVTLDAVAITNP